MAAQKVHISLKAQKLPNAAGFLKGTSDPFAVLTLYNKNDHNTPPVKIGKTEVVKNNLSPDWIQTFTVEYDPDMSQSIHVKVYDQNSYSSKNNTEMASATFDLDTVMSAKGHTKSKQLKRGGVIDLRAEEAKGSGNLRLKLSGMKLKNTEGFMRMSDPFYQFERKDVGLRGTEWNIVHRSGTINDNLNPNWSEEKIDLSVLCRGNLDEILRFSVMDYESSGDHVLMGQIEMSVNDFVKRFNSDKPFDLMKKGKDTSRGQIKIHVVSLESF
jgi:Ca2+-dependent lipid-binding protein